MHKSLQAFLFIFAFLTLSGCFSPSNDFPRGSAAYAIMPASDSAATRVPYRIGELDTLSIRVFQEPELSFDQIQVDASGSINFPLVGAIQASGKTPLELGEDIEAGLGERFIRSPQVVVGVVQSVAQRVVVEGNVIEPGVYDIAGSSSLLESIARAQGLTRIAVADEIVVLRTIEGKEMGAVFDLESIREGKAPDPEILGGDRIVVGFSVLKSAYRDILSAAPIFNLFRAL